nr:gamma-glutamyl-gamma-aminobutyrate hydrolase family protein [Thermoanaerobaculia bacterium]
EFEPESSTPVIYKLRDLLGVEEIGGTMRLGGYPCRLAEGTLARRIYGTAEVRERHRHRYEVNPRFVPTFVENGLVVSGTSPDGKFVEIVELPGHPWFLGCQFHPEFRSKPWDPHPLFVSYVEAALRARETRAGDETIASRPAAAIEAGG